jgi:phosphoglycerate dehydrogenase-like enzyme
MKLLAYHARGDEYRRLIARRCPDLWIAAGSAPETLEQELPDADILLTFRLPLEALRHGRRLRWLQLTSAGADHLLPAADLLRDVTVTNARGIHAELMADYVFGVLVMQQWDFPRLLRQQAARQWRHQYTEPLGGKTLGVVGLGAIGLEIARRAPSFGLSVLGLRRTAAPVPGMSRVYTPEGLHEMLGQCDFVVLVVPETAETRHMIGEAELRAMKPTAYLVNVARGGVVDETALLRALRERWIAGAALDVLTEEPPPSEHPFWTMDNVILTPHIAGEPARYVERVVEVFVDNYRRFATGQPLQNVVDLAKGY